MSAPYYESGDSDDRSMRSNAPSPMPAPLPGPSANAAGQDQTPVKSARPTPAPIDTSAEEELEYVAFNVRDFEDRHDPLMFTLEYTEKCNNYQTMRNKALIPEKYLDRMFFKSPCLNHSSHDKEDSAMTGIVSPGDADGESSTDKSGSGSVNDDADATDGSDDGVTSPFQEESDTDSIDWENDPSYQAFIRRLDQTIHLRKHRLHPVSRYVNDEDACEGCQIIPPSTDITKGAKEELNNKDYKALERRHQSAEIDLAEEDHWDGRSCPICGETFRSHLGQRKATSHWFEHHQNYLSRVSLVRNGATDRGEDPEEALVANSLTVNPIVEYKIQANLNDSEDDFTRDKFHYMEQVCLLAENEVLEREEFCRVCYKTFQYGDVKLVKHYEEHKGHEMIRSPLEVAGQLVGQESFVNLAMALDELSLRDRSPDIPWIAIAPWVTKEFSSAMARSKYQQVDRAEVERHKEKIQSYLSSERPKKRGRRGRKDWSISHRRLPIRSRDLFKLQSAPGGRAAMVGKRRDSLVEARSPVSPKSGKRNASVGSVKASPKGGKTSPKQARKV